MNKTQRTLYTLTPLAAGLCALCAAMPAQAIDFTTVVYRVPKAPARLEVHGG